MTSSLLPRFLTLDLQVGCPPSITQNLSPSLESGDPTENRDRELKNGENRPSLPWVPVLSHPWGHSPRMGKARCLVSPDISLFLFVFLLCEGGLCVFVVLQKKTDLSVHC